MAERIGTTKVGSRTIHAASAIMSAIAGALLLLSLGVMAQTKPDYPYLNPKLPADVRARDLVSRMTLEEKASQMVNDAAAIDRLNVPAYNYWSEGLHGVARSGYATQFPQAIGMAATWDEPLLHEIGTAIATEARAKYNDAIHHGNRSIYYGLTLWSPNINIFRDPRWGRGQETYGEDPFLTGRLGTAFVRGIQGDNPDYLVAVATPKHFAVHSGPESERHSMNVSPSDHDLWDTYLPAFRATIVEGKADSVMCAYNAIYAEPACGSKLLLQQILRDYWSFKGFVTSDCAAIDDFYSEKGHHISKDKEAAAAAGVKAGTDTNCGSTYLSLVDSVKRGLISEKEIDTSVTRLFEARMRLGLFDNEATMPYAKLTMYEVHSPAHTALALRTAEESLVLLKNDRDVLPLASGIKRIAVIGPNASALAALEGNYNAIAQNPLMPVDAIAAAFPSAKVSYAQGAPYVEGLALPISRTHFHPSSESKEEGLYAEYFANGNFQGEPDLVRTDKQIDFDWSGASPIPGIPLTQFSVRWTGSITMPAAGDYKISAELAPCYPCADYSQIDMWVDGKRIDSFELEKKFRGSDTPVVTMHVDDTKPHAFKVEYVHRTKLFGAGITLEWTPFIKPLLDQAVAIAKDADVVVAFVGLSPGLEGEQMSINVPGFSGGDRTDISLPKTQQQMLEALKATGKPLVVVLMNGSALAVNWAQQNADAILEAWYPGEAGAKAIAETLVGKNNPSGRLPITFYSSVDQLPAFNDYSMSNRTYRYFKGKPLYEFGYGLSYTKFAYSHLTLSSKNLKAGLPLTATVDVKNTGAVAGDEVAELYLFPPQTSTSPHLSLQAFQRIHLAPGETRHMTFLIDERRLSQVDDRGVRAVRAGKYQVSVGGAQPTAAGDSQVTSFAIRGSKQLPK
jgi:beta-glucosidase